MPQIVIVLLLLFPLYAQERIITLSPAIAEIVSGLGMLGDIVAVSDYTLYPEALQSKPKVGGYMTLSLERILSHDPTLVIGLSYQKPLLSRLQAFGIPTQQVQLESIEDIKKSIAIIATQLNRHKEGESLIAEIETSLRDAPKLTKRHSVLIVFANSSSLSRGVYVAGHDLFFEEVLKACGATNAYTTDYSLQPILDIEGIIATDPDSVLLLLGAKDKALPSEVKAQWQALPIKAAKADRIKVIQNNYILIPSQRIAKTITTLCKAIE